MTKPRATRAKPTAHTQAQLTERDLTPLESLAWAGFLATGQIQTLHYPSRRVAQRRLRALLDHGLVRAALQGTALQNDNLFALTAKGVDYLTDHHNYERDAKLRVGRLPRASKMKHGLRIRDAFVEFLLAERERCFAVKDILIESSPFAGSPLVPDLTVGLEGRDHKLTLFIEVDLGSETSNCLRRKFASYPMLLGEHRLLVLVEREGRRETVLRILADTGVRACSEVLLFRELGAALREPTHPLYGRARLFVRTVENANTSDFPEVSVPSPGAFRVLDGDEM